MKEKCLVSRILTRHFPEKTVFLFFFLKKFAQLTKNFLLLAHGKKAAFNKVA
jgi:hypothetical protein